MKKQLSIILMCVILSSFLTTVSFAQQERTVQKGFMIEFNGEESTYTSVICNNIHYVPLRIVFEKLGAVVFYRSSDRQILVLSRDGDIVRHIVGDTIVTVNEEQKIFDNPSISYDGQTYIPLDMAIAALCLDNISYDDQQLNIQKYLFQSDYHEVINDVLVQSKSSNFYPQRFQRYIKYHVQMPDYSVDEVVFRVNLGLDYPFYENVTEIEYPHELLVLVNKYFKLPADFEQYNLVPMNPQYTAGGGKAYLMAGSAYEKYAQMADAAKKDGLFLRVVSSYRTESYQRNLYHNKVRTTGTSNAERYSARPGFSEHQTGLAVDINSTKGSFEKTAEFQWLQQYAHEYGYILRYPKGKEWITGYAYEPWHYRYVGADAAKIIYEEGITYEEYYAKYVSVNEFR